MRKNSASSFELLAARKYRALLIGTAALLCFAALAPSFALAQPTPTSFNRQGIFGCSRNAAALSNSVGAFSAIGGVYVPVADYAVELNTGTLVYQQCVLRGIVNRESESVTAAMAGRVIQYAVSGNDGGPAFRSSPDAEVLAVGDRMALRTLQRYQQTQDAVSRSSNGGGVLRTAAQTYMASRREDDYRCPYDVNLDQCRTSPNPSDDCLNALAEPKCMAGFQTLFLQQSISEATIRELSYINDELEAGGGFYSRTHIDANGDRIIDTPSSIIQEQVSQALTSGFRRVESANDIDQMIGALYAGLGTQALTGSGGLLTGLTTSIGSGGSYLSRMSAESNAGLRNAAANAALQILASARSVEVSYNQIANAIAATLTTAIGQLRNIERQCWELIAYNTSAKHVCAAAPVNGQCTGVSGAAITIATSTQFSQAVIDANITPVANQVVANIQKSQAALAQIDQLIQGVTNTSSLDAQRLALVQLDQLVSQGRLHVAADVTAAQQQQAAVTDAMTQLVQQTKTLWADDPDPNKGWCNVNNQAVIDFWDSQWR